MEKKSKQKKKKIERYDQDRNVDNNCGEACDAPSQGVCPECLEWADLKSAEKGH